MNDAKTAAIGSGNQIEKFDPSRLMDGVKDRIRATFVSLIPDEAWDAMVEREIYVFTTGRIMIREGYKAVGHERKDMEFHQTM